MVHSSETAAWDLKKNISRKDIVNFVKALQVADQLSEDDLIYILKLLEVNILHNKIETPLCQKLMDVIVSYLRTMKPGAEVEKVCTAVLMAVGSHFPQMVIVKLWTRPYVYSLPVRSLLIAVGNLSLSPGTVPYIGSIWKCIMRFLRMAQEEDDMLALCQVLNGLVTSVRKNMGVGDDKVIGITQNEVSIKAYYTFRVLFNRWSLENKDKVTEQVLVIISSLFYLMSPSKLKNQVNRLTRWLMTLMSTEVMPFYISQLLRKSQLENTIDMLFSLCICQLVNALALSGCGGVNLESQLENITDMLFRLLSEKVNPSDPHSVENHSFTVRAFFILTKLYKDQMISLVQKTVESSDPAKIVLALEVFTNMFEEVSLREKLQRKVVQATILVIQEDLKPVPKAFLSFIEKLSQHDYFSLPQGNTIINYIIKLTESDSSNEEDIQIICSKVLQMVYLPKLITLLCDPSNILAFVPLSRVATEMALKASSQGRAPYLSGFHLTPTWFISPQRLLIHLVMFSWKPYREKEFGASSLRLLHALHPITSLHPVIHSNLGQLWMKVIPQMLKILDDHSVKTLNQKEWEDRLLQFLSQSLVAIDDDNWLEKLIRVILEMIHYFSEDADQQAFLYKLFGFSLRIARNEKLVKMMLFSILQTSHEELQEREGLAVVLSVVSTKHLKTVLEQLQVYSAILTDKDSSPILKLMKEYRQREWVMVCNTIYLSYSKIISENKGTIFMHVDGILALVLEHYNNCIVEKDKNLKLDYLTALTLLTDILSSQQPMALPIKFPHKMAIVNFLVELIKEEPLDSISSSVRQKAIDIFTNFRMLRPLLEIDKKVELLRLCFKSVVCLPPTEVLQREASSPEEAQANVDLFKETLQSLQRLMEAFITEIPTRIQNCLELMDTWLNSKKDNERERAMWCAARILGFATKMGNFKMEIEFTHLGSLVKLLVMRCQDPVDNICFLSSQAVYNLYCILSRKKQMKRQKEGLREEERKSEVYSANLFYSNTTEIAEAFAEYFTQTQLTTLVLTAMEELTSSRAKLSLASAQLMSAVMKERGTDMVKVEEIVEGIMERLKMQLEPSTKEETLRAMCLLAGNNTRTVVPLLLNKPLPWDRTILTLWKVFGTRAETTISILQLLISILEKHSTKGMTEMALRPVAAVCALFEMLSGSLCQDPILELYPRLLLALLCHLYWVIEQNTPMETVVYRKDKGPGSKSNTFDPTGCALNVVKLVLAAAYDGVLDYADEHKCWNLLSCPKFYYMGIMELTSGIVKNCDPAILHQILNLVNNRLYSTDNRQRILARSFYAQLLWHRSVAQTLGQDFVGNLTKWIKDPDLVMKEIGLRGISNLALHPGKSQSLKSLVPFLRDFLKSEWRVTVQAVKALRNIIYHGRGEDTKVVFGSISKHLRPLINDEMDQVRISAISALGYMLFRVDKFKPGYVLRKEIYSFLVPLLLSFQDNNADVVKACGKALTEWTKVIGWPSLTHMFQYTTLSDHIHVLGETCKYLVNTRKKYLLGNLLIQSFDFLKSTQPFLRVAAVHFIALIVEKINLNNIHEDDVEILQNTLRSIKNDPLESIQTSVCAILETMEQQVTLNHISNATVSTLYIKLSDMKIQRKKRLFKTVTREEDHWLPSPLNSLYNWCKGQ